MLSLRLSVLPLLVLFTAAVFAQPGSDASGDVSTAEEDEVLQLVREMRKAEFREPAVVEPTIAVYTTHYMVGEQRFETLDDALKYIDDFPPTHFALVRLAECSARPKMEELLARKAERVQEYLQRLRDEGRSVLYESGISTPHECPW